MDLPENEQLILEKMPLWLKLTVPPNAVRDEALIAEALSLVNQPDKLQRCLDSASSTNAYPHLINLVNAHVWPQWTSWVQDSPFDLLNHARIHFPRHARLRVLRRLAKHPQLSVRSHVKSHLEFLQTAEVSLPTKTNNDWNAQGWFAGIQERGDAFKVSAPEKLKNLLPKISTVGDLRELLQIKSSKQLGWLLLATDGETMPYHRFEIPKRNGQPREICAPNWQLREVQRRILQSVLQPVPVHDCAHGFVPGRSILTNASPHVGNALILKFDLQQFFPTITYARVTGLFTRLGYFSNKAYYSKDDDSHRVAATLARLCVYAAKIPIFMKAYCPQGAPTSPAISNLICRRLDARCFGLAEKFGGKYTRYADDLTFSFPDTSLKVGRFRWWVDQICHQEGFYVNHKKFRIMRSSRRQSVTGIVVNDCLRVPREKRRKFRAIIHDAQKNGLKAAARGRPGFANWMLGFAAYLNMVHPHEEGRSLELVRELLSSEGQV
jgi:retron-type reverse transcriptase